MLFSFKILSQLQKPQSVILCLKDDLYLLLNKTPAHNPQIQYFYLRLTVESHFISCRRFMVTVTSTLNGRAHLNQDVINEDFVCPKIDSIQRLGYAKH